MLPWEINIKQITNHTSLLNVLTSKITHGRTRWLEMILNYENGYTNTTIFNVHMRT